MFKLPTTTAPFIGVAPEVNVFAAPVPGMTDSFAYEQPSASSSRPSVQTLLLLFSKRRACHPSRATPPHAVARLVLHPLIPNIQAARVEMGPQGVSAALNAGANDLGGTLLDESMTRAAGAHHGQELCPARMEEIIRAQGREPRQRTTTYGTPDQARISTSFAAPPLMTKTNTPLRRKSEASRLGWALP